MCEKPLLTVLMPVYNVEGYIKRGLDSLLKQKNENFEILVINDGSTDKTPEIVESYRHQFKHLKMVSQPNMGLSAARNTGLDNVETPYLTFLDGDDWVEPEFTNHFIKNMSKQDVDLATSSFFIDYEGKPSKVAHKKNESKVLDRGQMATQIIRPGGSVKGYTWNKCYRIDLIRKHNLKFDETISIMEDQYFNLKYLEKAQGSFFYSTKPLYHYIQRDDSLIHNIDLKEFAVAMVKCHGLYINLSMSKKNNRPNKKQKILKQEIETSIEEEKNEYQSQ
ncbi:glycosyltransferase family 2 protein [Holzapfeliella floricola]|uniref:Glycosyltransferase n=1 Tax=Holzapfeliella floricola DSM 23037 = JCM 16512 TaxID=1423744 RepID=A0A0R2DKS0_9LACO|nr:glycosyltransferase family A protein [Holzapfeliella floricola]KRN04769.1 glycosyltransferase [Holzapfeliella floricola DSM 23037 = JCM 16512]